MAAKDDNPREASMEEVLSSIRRIISTDGAAGEKLTPDRAWADPPVAPRAGEPRLDLPSAATDRAPPPDVESPDADPEPDAAAPAPEPAETEADESAGLLSKAAETASIDALARVAAPQPPAPAADGDAQRARRLAADLLRPLLREWLDAHLPAMVEDIVRAEVRRLAERARR